MKILHVAESVRGGVGTYLNNIAPPQIDKYGSESIKVLVPDEHADIATRVEAHNLLLYRRGGRSVGALLRLALAVRAAIATEKPDIVHAHSTFAGVVCRLVCIGLVKPRRIIYTPHGWAFYTQSKGLKRLAIEVAERVLARFCFKVVAVSARERKDGLMIGIPGKRIVTVLNGIPDTSSFSTAKNWDESRLKVLFVGRLDRQKGFDVLCNALAGLEDEVALRVIGEAVNNDTGQLTVPRNVEFLGWQSASDVDSHLRSADVVVIPSRWEGLPLIALEAMRAGRYVIATDVGGNPEVIIDGSTGHLFQSEDCEQLRSLLRGSTQKRREELGLAARELFLQKFTIDSVIEGLDPLYRGAMQG